MGFTTSRLISRKSPMKGVRSISFAPFLASTPVVNTVAGVIALPAIMTTPPAIARIEVKATGNNVADVGTMDENTRTNEYVATNTFFVPGNDIGLLNQVQGMAGTLQTIFIEDYNGVIKVQGSQNGCDVMTVSGGSDMQGFSFTVASKEVDMMYILAPAGITAYKAALLANG